MTDSRGDTRALPDGGFGEAFERCAACGAILPRDEWCPTVTETDDDGRLVVRSFCDEACKGEWADDGKSE